MKLPKLIGLVLGVSCVALIGVSGLLASGFGARISSAPPADVGSLPLPADAAPLAPDERQFANTDVVSQRPLFSETRTPEADDGDAQVVDIEQNMIPLETAPLDVTVNGIIIAPDLRMAIVTDNKTRALMRVREGMPLEDDMAGWTLTEVQPRQLVFNGEGQGEAVVELVTDKDGSPPVPGMPSPQVAATEEEGEEEEKAPTPASTIVTDENGRPTFAPNADAAAQAEEIRRRVAERRAQLRAEAERRREDQQN